MSKKLLGFSAKEVLAIVALILFDQVIKVYVWKCFYPYEKTKIIGNLLYFTPHLNTKYAYVLSFMDMQVSRALILLVTGFCFYLGLKLRQSLYGVPPYKLKGLSLSSVNLFLAGGFCSLIDRLFWGGSLDYLYVERLFIMDLKDIYVSVSMSLLVCVYMVNLEKTKKLKAADLLKLIKN